MRGELIFEPGDGVEVEVESWHRSRSLLGRVSLEPTGRAWSLTFYYRDLAIRLFGLMAGTMLGLLEALELGREFEGPAIAPGAAVRSG